MSSIAPWWNSTITLYNRYEDKETQQVTWYRTVLTDCFWKHSITEMVNESRENFVSTATANAVICRIPQNSKYLSPYEWNKLPQDKLHTKFTLQIGDILVSGRVTDEIDEYTKGKKSTDLRERYKDKGVLCIENVSNNVEANRYLAHYAVEERGNKSWR